MISPMAQTSKYSLQPSLLDMHRRSLEWLSASALWKNELSFFQKLLDKLSPSFTSIDDKKRIDHFQSIVIYYNGEVVDGLRKKLKQNEDKLANMLHSLNESDTEYYKEHDSISEEVVSFVIAYSDFKHEFFAFMEKGM